VPQTNSAADEATTIKAVLGQLVSDLLDIDAANQAGAGVHAHIFLYEPSKAGLSGRNRSVDPPH